MGSSGYKAFKALFGALALVGFVWLLLVGILEGGGSNGSTTTTTTTTTTTRTQLVPAGSFKHVEMEGSEKHALYTDQSDLYVMSKRRVPNGPDPIHNRRAGNSRRPPGHA